MARQPLGMFEPLKNLLSHHGDKLQDKLSGMRTSLSAIDSNTRAQLVRNQSMRRSVSVPAESTEPLRNDSAYGWIIKWVASSELAVRIYIGTDQEESFFCELDPGTPGCAQERVEWYLPIGGIIFIKNEDNEDLTYVNFEVEVLLSEAAQGHTGPSDEHIEIARREPIPSGSPLDTPTLV